MLLKIYCDYDRKEGRVEVLQADRPILVRGVPVRDSAPLDDGDTIRIDAGQVLRCNFSERIIEEERNIIRSLEVHDLVCRFRNRQVALDGISFSVQRGEMVCVMGASGSRQEHAHARLAGQFQPTQGRVLFNGPLALRQSRHLLKGTSLTSRRTTRSMSTSRSRRICSSPRPFARRIFPAATARAASKAN